MKIKTYITLQDKYMEKHREEAKQEWEQKEAKEQERMKEEQEKISLEKQKIENEAKEVEEKIDTLFDLLKSSNQKILECIMWDHEHLLKRLPGKHDETVESYINETIGIKDIIESWWNEKLDELDTCKVELQKHMDDDDFQNLCFKHKIRVRRDKKPTTNFKNVEDYKAYEREWEEMIHWPLKWDHSDSDIDYWNDNLYTQIETCLNEAEMANQDRKNKVKRAETVVNMACGLIAWIMK